MKFFLLASLLGGLQTAKLANRWRMFVLVLCLIASLAHARLASHAHAQPNISRVDFSPEEPNVNFLQETSIGRKLINPRARLGTGATPPAGRPHNGDPYYTPDAGKLECGCNQVKVATAWSLRTCVENCARRGSTTQGSVQYKGGYACWCDFDCYVANGHCYKNNGDWRKQATSDTKFDGNWRLKPCPNGYEPDSYNGAIAGCWGCYAGTYGSGGWCHSCPVGRYTNTWAYTYCPTCPPGFYQNEVGKTHCKVCGPGQGSNQGASSCASCPMGYVAGDGPCKACLIGHYQNTVGQTTCKSCTPGQYQNSVGQSGCKHCPAGQYSDVYRRPSCWHCQPGKYQDSNAQSGCKNCPTGQYQASWAQSGCSHCQPGQYQNVVGQSSCKHCPPGQYQNVNLQTGCKNCPTGQYQDSNAQPGCKYCPTGQYQNVVGQSGCPACPMGLYQSGVGQTNCDNCPDGSETTKDGNYVTTQATQCDVCTPGKFQQGNTACTNCPNGYVGRSNGLSNCDKCPDGHESVIDGVYQEAGGGTRCSACAVNTFQTGGDQCTSCPDGHETRGVANTCQLIYPLFPPKTDTRAYDGSACTTTNPCGVCAGDCDMDSHCQPGLKCEQAPGYDALSHHNILAQCGGGSGSNRGGSGSGDYCYDPTQLVPMDWNYARHENDGTIFAHTTRCTQLQGELYNPGYAYHSTSSPYQSDAWGTNHMQGQLNSPRAWSAGSPTIGQWYQLELPEPTTVYGAVTQGRNGNSDQHVTSWKFQYSVDGTTWDNTNIALNQPVTAGSSRSDSPKTNAVDGNTGQTHPNQWHDQAIDTTKSWWGVRLAQSVSSVRVKVYVRDCCQSSLGNQMNVYLSNTFLADSGTWTGTDMHLCISVATTDSGIYEDSCQTSNKYLYLYVRPKEGHVVLHIPEIEVYSTSTYVDDGAIFPGNTDQTTKVEQTFMTPVVAKYIRFYPQTWTTYMSARMGLRILNTPTMLYSPTEGALVSSSSNWPGLWQIGTVDQDYTWICGTIVCNGGWYQIELPDLTTVFGAVTQGRHDAAQWVTSWQFKYSADGSTWTDVDGGAAFHGNTDQTTKVEQTFGTPVVAKYIRFYPITNIAHAAARMGLHMNAISKRAITSCSASSRFDDNYKCQTAYDGSMSTEWAIAGSGPNAGNSQNPHEPAVGSWIQFYFDGLVSISQMKFANRASAASNKVQLLFSDGQTTEVTLNNDGNLNAFNLGTTYVTTSVKITVQTVYHDDNNGAREIEFWGPTELLTRKTIDSCTASTEYNSDYRCEYAYDGIVAGGANTEWAIKGSMESAVGSWIQLNFAGPVAISRMKFANRGAAEKSQNVYLFFSDGQTVGVTLNNDAELGTFDLGATYVTTSVKIRVFTAYSSVNNGAREIEFWGPELTATTVRLLRPTSVTVNANGASGNNYATAGVLTDGVTDTYAQLTAYTWGNANCDTIVPYVTLDLGQTQRIDTVTWWTYYFDSRQYCAQRVALSNTGDFTGEEVDIYNDGTSYGPLTSPQGQTAAANGEYARYVRLWVGRNIHNAGVHLLEVRVNGRPQEQLDNTNILVNIAGSQCVACPAAKYQTGSAACASCAAGKHGNTGTVGSDSCTDCPEGRYAHNARDNATHCTACGTGKYSSAIGQISQSTCQNCATYTYQDEQGQSVCKTCPVSETSDIGDSICRPICYCDFGQAATDCTAESREACSSCIPGYGVYDGKCKLCEPNHHNPVGGAICTPCPVGQGSERGQPCEDCPPGKQSDGNGQECYPLCPAGTFAEKTRSDDGIGTYVCTKCALGKYSDTPASACTDCPLGRAQNKTGATSCTACPERTFSNETGLHACHVCDDGTGFGQTGLTKAVDCLDCAANHMYNSGTDSCDACPIGEQRLVHMDACETCPAGKTSEEGQACTPCPMGTYSNDNRKCIPCLPGTTSPAGSTSADDCIINPTAVCSYYNDLDCDQLDVEFEKDCTQTCGDAAANCSNLRDAFVEKKCGNQRTFPTFVDIGFNNATYIVCEGQEARVTWNGNHNIGKALDATSCESNGTIVEQYFGSGHVQLFVNDELAAQPGQTRYFKCDAHCAARFKTYCPG